METNKVNERQSWPDFCKFFAMLMVTWGHMAQAISGELFCNLLGGGGKLVAFHMPLFFLISGYFINPEKLRSQRPVEFIKQKFQRLMIPAICWYLIYALFTFECPQPYQAVTFYWYLTCLFVCQIIIYLSVKWLDTKVACLLSIVLVLLCPGSHLVKINFMLPFLWAGYYLKTLLSSRYSKVIFWVSLLSAVGLYFIWDEHFSVYLSPWKILQLNKLMVLHYVVRFILGFCVSYVIIYISRQYDSHKVISFFSKYGQCTLVAYTFSIIIYAVLNKACSYYGLLTNAPIILDVVSFLTTIIVYWICAKLYLVLKMNRITNLLLLGEK